MLVEDNLSSLLACFFFCFVLFCFFKFPLLKSDKELKHDGLVKVQRYHEMCVYLICKSILYYNCCFCCYVLLNQLQLFPTNHSGTSHLNLDTFTIIRY